MLESWTFVRLVNCGKDKEKDIYKRGRNGLGLRQWYRMFLFLSWCFRSLNLPGPSRLLLDKRLFWTRVWVRDGFSSQWAETNCFGWKTERRWSESFWLVISKAAGFWVRAYELIKWLMTTIAIPTLSSIIVYLIGLFSFCLAVPE